MASYSPRRSSGPVLRSTSPTGKLNCHSSAATPPRRPSSSSPFASASSAFNRNGSLRQPAISPTPLNSYKYTSPSLSFSLNIFVSKPVEKPAVPPRKITCMCSPTNHPGSFRCSLHKTGVPGEVSSKTVSCGSSSGLNMRRSAMKNSLVRIGTVEGDLVKRALAALIRPSSHQQHRRSGEFRPRPSRLSVVSTAER